MAQKNLPEMTQTLASLMRSQLGVRRGRTFADKLRKGGRLLPRALRQQAQVLVESEARAGHPKLRNQLDQAKIEQAYAAIEAHLKAIDPVDRLKGQVLGVLAVIAFNFLLVFAGVVIWMVSTGRL